MKHDESDMEHAKEVGVQWHGGRGRGCEAKEVGARVRIIDVTQKLHRDDGVIIYAPTVLGRQC